MKTNKVLKFFLTMCLFLSLLSVQAQTWQQHFDEGKRLYKNNDFEGAYEAFQRAQAIAPHPGQMDAYLAQTAYRAGKFDEAASAYQRTRENSSDTWSSYNQGNAQFRNNDINGAIESYKDALRKNPNNDMARYNLAYAKKKQQEQEKQQNKDDKQDKQKNPQEQPEDPNQNNSDQQNQDNQNKEQQNSQNQPKLGREQTEQLLESMNQADKKAQDKLKDKEKAVGSGKREKDW